MAEGFNQQTNCIAQLYNRPARGRGSGGREHFKGAPAAADTTNMLEAR